MIDYIFLQISNNSSGTPDALDALIVAAILLFILSTITEKFTELVRMYPGQFRLIGIIFCMFFYFQIIYGSFNEPILGIITAVLLFLFNSFLFIVILANTVRPEKATTRLTKMLSSKLSVFNNVNKNEIPARTDLKEREVTALSFMIGLIVSFLFNANLFNLFNIENTPGLKPGSPFAKAPSKFFALDPAFFDISFVQIIGFILTAFFLSFGAKFFHDLLDNLLQVKNLKRKMNDKADWEFNNISEFDKYIVSQEKLLYDDFLNSQLNKPGIFYESNLESKSVTVHISDPAVTIPDKLFYKTSLGKVWQITIIKKHAAGIRALSTTLFPSAEMANQLPFNNILKGSVGYFVKALNSANVFILTCYHVVWNGHDWDQFRAIGKEKIVHPIRGTAIGEIYVALKNTLVDAVLIRPDDVSMIPEIEGIGKVVQDRALNDGDINLTVKMRGTTSGNTEGYISELRKPAHIMYPDGTYKQLTDLIVIKTTNGQPFSKEGDSGSLVVDDFGFAIGMIVAGDGNAISLAIPFSHLRDQLNIELYKTI